MRPTFLDFRSPREKTPGPYFPTISRFGGSATFKVQSFSKNTSNLPTEVRFKFYDKAA
jgi:hypothetical protein